MHVQKPGLAAGLFFLVSDFQLSTQRSASNMIVAQEQMGRYFRPDHDP